MHEYGMSTKIFTLELWNVNRLQAANFVRAFRIDFCRCLEYRYPL